MATSVTSSSELQINTFTSGDQKNAQVCKLNDGSIVMAWYSSLQGGLVFQRFDSTGAKLGAETVWTFAYSQFDICALTNGGFSVSWAAGTYVQFQQFDAQGSLAGSIVTISGPGNSTASKSNGMICGLTGGGWVEAWYQANDVRYAQYNPDGTKLVERTVSAVSQTQRLPDVVALSNGGYAIAYVSNHVSVSVNSVFMQFMSATGVVANSSVSVGSVGSVSGQTSAEAPIALDTNSTGVGIAWRNYSGQIYFARYNNSGVLVGSAISVGTASLDSTPSLAFLNDGGWVIAWHNTDSYNTGIYAQRYNASGVAVGSATLINSVTTDIQSIPSIDALTDGGYLISWQSNLQDGSGYGIFAQRFDAVGNKLYQRTTWSLTSGIDVVTGSSGIDFVNGISTDDSINTGSGDDIVSFSSADFALIDGGSGRDVLSLSQNLDLRTVADSNLKNLEVIQFTAANLMLTLTFADVAAITDASGVLLVQGASGKVRLDVGWTQQTSGGYNIFTQNGLTLKIDSQIALDYLPTGSVIISGTATPGQTLSASNSLSDLDGLGAISYTWKDSSGTVLGTGTTLVLTEAHLSKDITVTASYTDGRGTAESASSAPIAVVASVNSAPTGSVTISGTAAQGQTLSASNTLADTDGLGPISYQWKADGLVIAGATASTLVLTEAQVGKAITVTASYTDGMGKVESLSSAATSSVANVNDPLTGSLSISGTATQGQTLSAVSSLADADGLGAISYTWKNQLGTVLGSGSTYLLTQAEVGQTITVTASYTDGHGTAESITSAATLAVTNVNDAPTGSLTISGSAIQGSTLSASNTLADLDGLGPISYTWKNNLGTTLGTGASIVLTEAEVGKTITVTATYTDGFGTSENKVSAATAPVANVNDAPTGSVIISGLAEQGQTLSASNSIADLDGLGAISYQWKANGTAISGATASTYVLTESEVGKVITLTASYTDGHGSLESLTSAATASVANVNDAPTGSVSISGDLIQGQTLTAVSTLSDLDGLGPITYTWFADGAEIAQGESLVLTQAQVGKTLSVTASYTDGHGTLESSLSALSAAVQNLNDAPTGSVSISGELIQGQTLTASNTLADIDGLGSITYTWKNNLGAILGTGTSFVLTESEVGQTLSVTATYTDALGTAESSLSAESTVVQNLNDAPSGSVSISGELIQGQTLTASNSLSDIDGLGPISYTWLDGEGNNLGSGETMVLTQAHVGKTLTVTASYTDGHGTLESSLSSVSAVVQNLNDAPSGSVSISGDLIQGQSLTASNSLSDIDGLGPISYTWFADGAEIAQGESLSLTQAQVGKAISVRASYTDAYGSAESALSSLSSVVQNLNDAPTGSVSISGELIQGQTLTAVSSLSDLDGLGLISYSWLDGEGNTLGVSETLLLTQAHVGKTLSVTASYTDAYGTLESSVSSVSSVLQNLNDAPTGSVAISGELIQGQTLTASNTLVDLDGLGPISYKWFADGTELAQGETLVLTEAQVGKAISVTASYTDGHGTSEAMTSTATAAVLNVNEAPSGTVSISGELIQGQTLIASNTLADLDGLGPITYTWLADGTEIAQGETLTLTHAQVGKTISVTASYTDAHGTLESSVSSVSSGVQNLNDAPTGSVSISGLLHDGETLTASHTLTDLDGLGSISYQWLADGLDIAGANTETLSLSTAELGKLITVRASYVDGYGQAEGVVSAASAAVTHLNRAPTGDLSISGTATQGQILSALSSVEDLDGLGDLVYTWYADGVAIDGENDSTLLLHQAQVGKVISVSASYTDGFENIENIAVSAPTTPVADANVAASGYLIIEGNPVIGNTLVAKYDFSDWDAAYLNLADEDGGMGTLSFTWSSVNEDGSLNFLGNGTSYTLTAADLGKILSLSASYTDGEGQVESVAAYETTEPVVAPGIAFSAAPAFGSPLSLDVVLPDADSSAPLNYSWSSSPTGEAGSWTEFSTAAEVIPDYSLYGQFISVSINYTDAANQPQIFTVAPQIFDQDLSDSIEVTWNAGSFTASNPLDLPSNAFVWHFQNLEDDTLVDGSSTGISLAVTGAMTNVNLQIAGSTGTSVSSATIPNDPLSGAWEISRSGAILSITEKDMSDADGIRSMYYSWQDANGEEIGNGASFDIDSPYSSPTQVNTQFKVVVTYADQKGDTETYTIDNIIIQNHLHTTWNVDAANLVSEHYGVGTLGYLNDADILVKPEHEGEVMILSNADPVETPVVGDELMADTSMITDDDGMPTDPNAFSYRWEKSRDGLIWQPIVGQTQSTLTLDNSLAGYTIRSRVEFTDLRGSQEVSYSKATDKVLPAFDLVGELQLALETPEFGAPFLYFYNPYSVDPENGESLKAFDTIHAVDNRPITVTYEWFQKMAQGADLSLGSGQGSPALPFGEQIYCVATGTDASGQTKSISSSLVKVEAPAEGTVLTHTTSYSSSGFTYINFHIDGLSNERPIDSITWQKSFDGGVNWIAVNNNSSSSWPIAGSIYDGFQVRAQVSYQDAQGFGKVLYTAAQTQMPSDMAPNDPETYHYSQSSFVLNEGETQVTYTLPGGIEDNLHDYGISYTWQTSMDGENWIEGYSSYFNDGQAHSVSAYINRDLAFLENFKYIRLATYSMQWEYNANRETLHQTEIRAYSNAVQLIPNHHPFEGDLVITMYDESPISEIHVGDQIRAMLLPNSESSWTIDQDGLSLITYTWSLDGQDISHDQVIYITEEILNKTLTVSASYTDGWEEYVETEEVTPVILPSLYNEKPVITRSLDLTLIDDQWHLITLADLQGTDAEDGEYAKRLTFSMTQLPTGLSFYLGDTPPQGAGSATSFTLKDIIQNKVWMKVDAPASESGGGSGGSVVLPNGRVINISMSLKDLALAEISRAGSVSSKSLALNGSQFVELDDPSDFTFVFDASGKIIMFNNVVDTESEDKKGFMTKIGDGISKGVDVTVDGTLFGLKLINGKLWTGIGSVKDGLVWAAGKSVDGLDAGLHLATVPIVKPIDWSIGKLWDNPWQIGPATDKGIDVISSALRTVLKTGVTLPLGAPEAVIDTFISGYKQWAASDLTGVFKVKFDNNNQLDGTNGLILNEKGKLVWDKVTYDGTLNKNHAGDEVHLDRLGASETAYSFDEEKTEFANEPGKIVVFINGQANTLTTAAQLALHHGNSLANIQTIEANQKWKPGPDSGPQPQIHLDPVYVFHNETGGASDLIESSLLKLMPQTTVMVNHIADLIQARVKAEQETLVIGHSQGGILLTNALIELNHRDADNSMQGAYKQFLSTEYHGSAANVLVAKIANDALGSKFVGMANHMSDAVGVILGGTVNPVSWAASLLSAPLLSGAFDKSYFTHVPEGWSDLLESPHTLYPRIEGSEPWWQTLTNSEGIL
ncbi:MAG: hypothetical protein RL095_504 [Verrucomicrobiota bacterium]